MTAIDGLPLQTSVSPARHLENVAVDVATLAADLVRASLGAASAAGTKSSTTDVVTETDVDSERLIRGELLSRCPGSSISGEELDDQRGANNVGWIVDPIDGTVTFLYDLPVVSVSIAATIDGKTVAGAVTDVLRRETYSATRGEGARIDDQPISVTKLSELAQGLVGTGFSYDSTIGAAEAEILHRLLPACRDVRCMGSAALNLCWVGSGRLNAFFERDIKTYDYAAGALIAAEAGPSLELPADNDQDLIIAACPGSSTRGAPSWPARPVSGRRELAPGALTVDHRGGQPTVPTTSRRCAERAQPVALPPSSTPRSVDR